MNLLNALILGVVEGVTEFLPVSSTAHLILVSKWLNINQTEWQKFFEVFIQSGAILAVIFLYFGYLMKHKDLIWKVLLSFIPTAIVGAFLYRLIKSVFFESTGLIAIALGVVGGFFIIFEVFIKKGDLKLSKTLAKVSNADAVLIGLVQSLAVIPGVSRAGIVFLGMMLSGYKRTDAAIYSFLLAVPTILAASLLDLYQTAQVVSFNTNQMFYLSVGFFVSFVTAYFSVKWLVGYLQKGTLTGFGLYRIALAIIVVLFLLK